MTVNKPVRPPAAPTSQGARVISTPPPQTQVTPSPARATQHIVRSRAYSFLLDERGEPVELGSGRYAKAYLGEEQWLESKTAFKRQVAIKILQRGVAGEDALRFQMEKELLERVQGHPNIVTLYASGESDTPEFVPPSIRRKVTNDFMIIELCDLSLEERLKGTRSKDGREDLLRCTLSERVFRALDYMIPVAAAIEFAHLKRGICHRDIKPANVLLKLPDVQLCGATLDVVLADFNVGKLNEEEHDVSLTHLQSVPGTIFFQSPEQETNSFELLVNVQHGSREVDYYEDFYIYISQNDTFQIFNRPERYRIAGADRAKKKLLLETPFKEASEASVRGKIIKSVDRPADIYSLGAMLYYLVSGAYANPKSLYDAFRKFIEYDAVSEDNAIDAYIEHEYRMIENMRAPKPQQAGVTVAPADRFFSYKHYLDGNGELIDKEVMKIIAQAMIRNKRDSYCQAWDVNTNGISEFVGALRFLYDYYGVNPSARPTYFSRGAAFSKHRTGIKGFFNRIAQSLSTPPSPQPARKPSGGSGSKPPSQG